MSDAKPMSKDQLRFRREQGRRLHEEATSGACERGYPPESVLRAWDGFARRFNPGFLMRRQAI